MTEPFLFDLLNKYARKSGAEITLETDLGEYLDSLDVVEVVMQCERQFDITVSDERMEEVKTGNELLELINEAYLRRNQN